MSRTSFFLLTSLLAMPGLVRAQAEARLEGTELHTEATAITKDHIFSAGFVKFDAMAVQFHRNHGDPISCWTYERNTAKLVGKGTIDFKYEDQQIIDWVALDGKVCLVYEKWDDSHKSFEVWARVFEMPSIKEIGQPFLVAHLDLRKRYDPPFFERFSPVKPYLTTSTDGTKACFYFDKVEDRKGEQLVLTSVFTASGLLWTRTEHIPFDSETIDNAGVALADNGVVHYLMKAYWNKYTLVITKKVKYSFVLYTASGDSMVERALTLPEGHAAANANVTVSTSGRVRIGGTYVEGKDAADDIAGYFHADLPPDAARFDAVMLHPIPGPPRTNMSQGLTHVEASDGTSYLMIEFYEISSLMKVNENGVFAAAIGPDGQELWRHMIPRSRVHKPTDPKTIGVTCAPDHGGLLIGFPDVKGNLPAFIAGRQPERTPGDAPAVSIFARIDGQGAVTWEYLPRTEAFIMLSKKWEPDVYDWYLNKGPGLVKFVVHQ